jgi:hypothetical protein
MTMNDSTGTGWPGIRQYMHDEATFTQHANVKLTEDQLDYIYDSGEPISQWIRDAIQARIDTEAHYKRANESHRRNLHGNTA